MSKATISEYMFTL